MEAGCLEVLEDLIKRTRHLEGIELIEALDGEVDIGSQIFYLAECVELVRRLRARP